MYPPDGTPELFLFSLLNLILFVRKKLRPPAGENELQKDCRCRGKRPQLGRRRSNRTAYARVAPIRAGSRSRIRKSSQFARQVLVFIGLSHSGDDFWHSPRRSRIDRSSRRAPNGRGNEPLAPHLPGGFPSTEHGPQSKG